MLVSMPIAFQPYRNWRNSEVLVEKVESLEQLRWLENGYKIKTNITNSDNFGIDTPEDLAKVLAEGIDKYYR